MRRGSCFVLAIVAGCHAAPASTATPMFPAGDHHDDSSGILARASYSLVTADDGSDDQPPPDTHRVTLDDPALMFGGATYGGLGYGGLAYGATGYGGASYGVQTEWGGAAQPPMEYEIEEGLTGAIEGVVTWSGALPARVAGGCASPTLRVGADRGVGGALVYIEKVEIGRVLPVYAKAATVGGVVVKRGCALMPPAQIVAPLPATLTIQGDATAAKLHVTSPSGVARAIELEEGGQAQLDALSGVVRVDSDDGKLAPAWVVGIDTPYYAVTDDAGRFRIDELAAGTYDVAVWQAPVAVAQAGGAVRYGAPVVAHRRINVPAGALHAARMNVALH